MDNEVSEDLKKYFEYSYIKSQLVPPHVHRINAAERDVRTFKNRFIAALCHSLPYLGSQHVCSHSELSPKVSRPVDVAPCGSCLFHFDFLLIFATLLLSYILDSLVHVSIQSKGNHSPSITSAYKLYPPHPRKGKID